MNEAVRCELDACEPRSCLEPRHPSDIHLREVRLTGCLFDQLRHLTVNAQRQILATWPRNFISMSSRIHTALGLKPQERVTPVATGLPAIASALAHFARQSRWTQLAAQSSSSFYQSSAPPLFLVACALSFSFPSPLSLFHSRVTLKSDLFQFRFEACAPLAQASPAMV